MLDAPTSRCHEFRALMRSHRLSTADVSELLELNLSHVRAMRAGLKPVTRKTLRLLQLVIKQRAIEIVDPTAA